MCPGPLENLVVIEVANENGQHCGKLFADLGAEVLKVEPIGGSAERRVGPFVKDEPDPNRSLFFWHYNTSKKGLTLNLDTPDGQGLLRRLAQRADILLESNRPGYMAERGLGYQHLRALNPELVYCSITPYGQDGPWAHFKATELTLMASGGQIGVCGYEKLDDPDETPIAPGGGNAWHPATHYAFMAIMAAIYARDLHHFGQYIDVSIQEAIAVCTEGAFPDWEYKGKNRRRQTARHATIRPNPTPRTLILCGDGKYLNVSIARLKTEDWLKLIEWLDSEGLAEDLTDDKYLDPAEQSRNMAHIFEVLARFALKHTAAYMFHESQKRKWSCAVIQAPSDLLEDAHLRERGFFVEVEHPELGRSFTYPGAPYLFTDSPWRIQHRAPLLGEHNLEVYLGRLGLSPERFNALHELGVI